MAESTETSGPGAGYVDRNGIIGIAIYLVLFAVALLAGLIWQLVTATADNPPSEMRLLCVVALAGAVGSLVHALRSFYWYVGNQQLVWSWAMMYILLPFVGAFLGLVFYLIIRGGFATTTQGTANITAFGYSALAALVGLFSEQALEKLRQIAASVFTKAPIGKNHQPAKKPPPTDDTGRTRGPNKPTENDVEGEAIERATK